jgi:hypothetical protein
VRLFCFIWLTNTAMAAAGERAVDRTVPSLRSPGRPAAVPSGYVLTHHGWFHPSCVVVVGNEEIVGADRVIRGMDGTAHVRFAPCAHAHYDSQGRATAANVSARGNPALEAAPQPAAPTYDGYIVYYAYSGGLATSPTLSTDWVVPPPPTNIGDQDIAFFDDLLTTAGGGDILQPVLDFNGEIQGQWSIESEHCCIAGNDEQTTAILVSPGDLIRGVVVGTGCDSTGACQTWTVTTTDVTTGKLTTLNTTAPAGVPNGASPASLETYGVSACDMFPAGGAATFMDSVLTSPGGAVQSIKYHLVKLDGVATEVPRSCGYGGNTSGDSYTLIYGEAPSGNDGGPPTGAGASGGDGGSGGGPSTGTGALGGQAGFAGSGGSTGAGGASASGGSFGGGGTTGRGGESASDAEPPPLDGSGTKSSQTGGCSCSTTPGVDSESALLFLTFALLISATSRGAAGPRRRPGTRVAARRTTRCEKGVSLSHEPGWWALTGMRPARVPANRRRHARFPLGLPVKLQVVGRAGPIIVEVVDVSAGGLRLRSLGDEVRVIQRATLRFVLPDQRACVATGRVTRVERGGAFVLALDEANDAFRSFLASLSAGGL